MELSLILNVLIAYGICQALFISAVVLRSKNRTLFKKLFAALLIIEGITLFERVLVEADLIQSVPHVLGISYPISFIKPPLMFLMTMAITVKGYKLSRKTLLHFIPFGLMLLSNLPFYFLSGDQKLEFVNQFMNQIPSYQSFEFYFTLSFFFYIGIYIFFSIRKMNAFRKQVANNGLVNWYRIVLIIYSSFLATHLLYFIFQPIWQLNFAPFNQFSMLVMTLIIQSIAFKVMGESTLFNAKAPDLGDLKRRQEREELILKRLEEDKIYREEDLSLQLFSESVSLPANEVSQIINQKFNCSFKKLISRYRIREAKELMKNSREQEIKLIDIFLQVGFNNKVSFYRAFKEFENMAPSEYLEKIKKGEIS